jgi:hypothetical protein
MLGMTASPLSSSSVVNAELVRQLRDQTGAGMMDCKKALTTCGGDLTQALDWLRKKGIKTATTQVNTLSIACLYYDARGIIISIYVFSMYSVCIQYI